MGNVKNIYSLWEGNYGKGKEVVTLMKLCFVSLTYYGFHAIPTRVSPMPLWELVVRVLSIQKKLDHSEWSLVDQTPILVINSSQNPTFVFQKKIQEEEIFSLGSRIKNISLQKVFGWWRILSQNLGRVEMKFWNLGLIFGLIFDCDLDIGIPTKLSPPPLTCSQIGVNHIQVWHFLRSKGWKFYV